MAKKTKKDACYRKVKARYKVWPSAYASGALSKCRKVGAANWGNSTKKAAEGGVMTSVDNPKRPARTNGKEEIKKRRMLSQGKSSVQGVAQRLRFGGTLKVSQSRGKQLGKLY